MRPLTCLVLLLFLVQQPSVAQQRPVETRRFAIDVAGVRIGTMTATRQFMPGNEVVYTQISDVQVNFLIYKLTIYYNVVSLFRNGQMINATVDAHTNKGNYASSTVWKGDHYDIDANQYKYTRKTTERRKIDYTVTMLYFSEPAGKQRVYAEYFGDDFTLTSTTRSAYRASLGGREDEYIYEHGRLAKVIKKNALKNFIIRPLD
ncbi:DUF6134 family protein [Fibrella aquatilis]|uniref:DUF4468 domain-containing protein n=1 Tax=Fibrella aquatilis TaxID=2817059 RepID=A0A939K1R3_9BACT|nr:DUF6134 family protein [Fibrella aquatilis]MBO0933326.1 hypothetical protein [Fibrella aquatilis]